MLLMFERGVTGRITQAVHGYAKANNKYMTGSTSSGLIQKKKAAIYSIWDVNNLYGWAMSQLLPAGGFEWVDLSLIMPDKIDSYTNCENEGYLLEVDVRYPNELHDLHNDLLFMCKKMVINGIEKLVPNFDDKRNYVVHIKALNPALSHGLILKKVHRVIKFNQVHC